MTKENRTKLSQSWSGRLIDIGGVEGSLTLSLSESKGKVQGRFDVIIDGIHRPVRRSGEIAGSLQGADLELTLSLGSEEYPVRISFSGKLRESRNKEMTLKGLYSVAFRRYPGALLGGVICATSQPKEGMVRAQPFTRWTTVEVTGQRPDKVTAKKSATTTRRAPARKGGKARSARQVRGA